MRAISVIQSLISSVVLISSLALPTLLQDIIDGADKWGNGGKTGRIDPFTEIYDVSIFSGSIRLSNSVPSLPLLARFSRDRPYDHMPRPGEERG